MTTAPDCVDGDDDRLISADVDVFATDRVTGLAVNDSKYLPPDAVKHEGLVNKFPFDSEKKTYPYWDGTVGEAVDAKYERTTRSRGTKVYYYEVNTKGASIDIADGVKGTYDDIKGDLRRAAHRGHPQPDRRPAAIPRERRQGPRPPAAFTDAQQKKSADDLSSDLFLLTLVEKIVPIVGIVGGLICLGAAGFLLVADRRRTPPRTEHREPAHV